MPVIRITKENFKHEVVESAKPVLLDFWAAWCGPCRVLSPIIEEIADERDDIKVGKVNIDEEDAIAEEFGIMSIPAVFLIKEGKVKARSVGVRSKEEILSMMDGING